MEEWKEARNIIDSLDSLLASLRKYGFSFITLLLGADSILGQATGQATVVLSPTVKLGVMLATLASIIGLYATDRFYRIIQEGAVANALQIESAWQLKVKEEGPTQSISMTYSLEKGFLFIDALYVLFGSTNFLLGAFILYPDFGLMLALLIASLIVFAFGYYLRLIVVRGAQRKRLRELIQAEAKRWNSQQS
jgi:hypothetical protein